MTRLVGTICVASLALLGGCDEMTPPEGLPPAIDAQLRQDLSRWGVIPVGAMPPQDPALVALGQALMFDKILSGNRDIACATCHAPVQHGGDGLSLAIGTGGTGLGPSRTLGPGRPLVPRKAPSPPNPGRGFPCVFGAGRAFKFGPGGPGGAGPDRGPPPPRPAQHSRRAGDAARPEPRECWAGRG